MRACVPATSPRDVRRTDGEWSGWRDLSAFVAYALIVRGDFPSGVHPQLDCHGMSSGNPSQVAGVDHRPTAFSRFAISDAGTRRVCTIRFASRTAGTLRSDRTVLVLS